MFRLALALGEPNPDALFRKMPFRVWREWQVYYTLEPWDETRADWRAAMMAMTMVNLWSKRGSRRARIRDFMPQFDREFHRPQTAQTMADKVRALNAWLGGEVVDKRNG